MRISDWSSDVCSSDLARLEGNVGHQPLPHRLDLIVDRAGAAPLETDHELRDDAGIVEIEDRLERIAHRAIPHVIDHADDRRGDEAVIAVDDRGLDLLADRLLWTREAEPPRRLAADEDVHPARSDEHTS